MTYPSESFKQSIDAQYPAGTFVAIDGGLVIADAETHRQLVEKLRSEGKSPRGMWIVQAGVDYPDSAVIF
jgi:hypothetical protein